MKKGVHALKPYTLPSGATGGRAGENGAIIYSQIDLIVDYTRETERLGI